MGISGLVTQSVLEYIEQNELYQPQIDQQVNVKKEENRADSE